MRELRLDGKPKQKSGPKPKEIKSIKTGLALAPHTVDTLNGLAESTGRSKSSIVDLAVDLYAGQFEIKPDYFDVKG